jgi:hypothetical protein
MIGEIVELEMGQSIVPFGGIIIEYPACESAKSSNDDPLSPGPSFRAEEDQKPGRQK